MRDNEATVKELKAKGVEFTRPVNEERWGRLTAFRLPDGEEMYLYQPKHPSPLAGVVRRRSSAREADVKAWGTTPIEEVREFRQWSALRCGEIHANGTLRQR